MIEATILDATGEIVSILCAPDQEHVDLATPTGGSALAEAPPSAPSYYANGAWVTKPACPAPYYAWDAIAKAWYDPRDLTQVQADQLSALATAYNTAISVDVSFTSAAGVTQTYDADQEAKTNVVNTLAGYQLAQATPSGFFWNTADNTHVPFTFADVQGLAAAIVAQGTAAFAKLQTLKAQVRAATTVDAAAAVVWA